MTRCLIALIALLFTCSVGAQSPQAEQTTTQHLLQQLWQAESIYRDDIIEDTVQRLYRIQPNHPEGLLAQMRLALRLERPDVARRHLEQLNSTAPYSSAAQEAAVLMHLYSDEAQALLAQARLFAATGRLDEALKQFDELLMGYYPNPEIAHEYWWLHARATERPEPAIEALTKKQKRYPKHGGLLKTLIDLHFANNQPEQALGYLHQLANNPSDKKWAAFREYDYLNTLDISHHSRQLWADYVQIYQNIPEMLARAQANLKRQEQLLADPNWWSGQKGLQLIAEEKSPAQALAELQKAVKAYPNDPQVIGALGTAYLRLGNRQLALHYFKRAKEAEPTDDTKSKWISLIAATEHWLLLQKASEALEQKQYQQAEKLYRQAYRSQPNDLFALIGLGDTYLAQDQADKAWFYIEQAIKHEPHNEMSHRALLRYARSLPLAERIAFLNQLPSWLQNKPLIAASQRDYQVQLLTLEADKAQDQADWLRAIDLLQQAQNLDNSDPWLSYRLAALLRDQGQIQAAFAAFNKHKQQHEGEPSTQYTFSLLLASVDRLTEAQEALDAVDENDWTPAMTELAQRIEQNQRLEKAQALYAAGQTTQAIALLQEKPLANNVKLQLADWLAADRQNTAAVAVYQELLNENALPNYAYRRFIDSWIASGGDAEKALDHYAHGMVATNILDKDAVLPTRDDVAFTKAMRIHDDDTWLELGLRRGAEELYQQQNPTLIVHHDYWWRSDGNPGVSKLKADTTMAQLNYPIKHGTGFIRLDHVRMDTGSLPRDADGYYTGEFGTCSEGSGCRHRLKQKASGTSAAIGWAGDHLSFDLGTTPQGFEISNWAGGISYADSFAGIGWRLTASRRPLSNSLLSFAGAKDPRTGKKWGGVMANGVALGLSWDQGEANGIWANISHHQLKGTNVDSNQRTRLMGGYYRRFINEPNELLTAGVNLMHWRYQKDLSGYRYGEGGYYSPKQYNSVSLPIRYAKRTDNWSFDIRAAASLSRSRSHDGSSGSGTGYTFSAGAERRLSKHLVLGAAIDLQHSKDYQPSRAMLYLRYHFRPWKGSLPLGLEPLIPYADF